MKKTISVAALALSASTSFAFIGPGHFQTKTYCLPKSKDAHGSSIVTTCDESKNNATLNRPLNSMGCAAGQSAMHATKAQGQPAFSPYIRSCLPPNVAQL